MDLKAFSHLLPSHLYEVKLAIGDTFLLSDARSNLEQNRQGAEPGPASVNDKIVLLLREGSVIIQTVSGALDTPMFCYSVSGPEFIGELALLNLERKEERITAVNPCSLLIYDAESLRLFLSENQHFRDYIWQVLADRHDKLRKYLSSI